MNLSVLNHFTKSQLPGPAVESLTETDPSSDAVVKQLYREIADLKVRNELLEQSLRNVGSGLLSDEKLWNDYQQLQLKINSQQQIIDSQNEMLDEAQSLMQQLREENESAEQEIEELRKRLEDVASLQTQLDYAVHSKESADLMVSELRKQLETATQQLAYQDSIPLPAVEELSEEDDSYTALQSELDELHLWLTKIKSLLFNSSRLSKEVSKDCQRIYSWCQFSLQKQSEPQKSILEVPYIALIQSEINELYLLIEGENVQPSPIKQLHTMQQSVQDVLRRLNQSALKQVEPNPSLTWTDAFSAYERQFKQCAEANEVDVSLEELSEDSQQGFEGVVAKQLDQLIHCVQIKEDRSAEIADLNTQLQEKDEKLERCASIFDSQKMEFDKLAALNKILLEKYQLLKQRTRDSNAALKKSTLGLHGTTFL